MNFDLDQILQAVNESTDKNLLMAIYDAIYGDLQVEVYEAAEARLLELGALKKSA